LSIDIAGVGFVQNSIKITFVHMKRRRSFKRGQLIQSITDSTIYIFIKKRGAYSHVVELDSYGNPVHVILIETVKLNKLKTIPDTFKSIEL
jgi:uncharacterized protein YcgL (UPF0745 family)